jgi:hypothetical protein
MRCRKLATVRRRVDLHHVVEVADVDAELERARGHDHAVLPLLERELGVAAGGRRQRAVGDEGGHAALEQLASRAPRRRGASRRTRGACGPVQALDDDRGVG